MAGEGLPVQTATRVLGVAGSGYYRPNPGALGPVDPPRLADRPDRADVVGHHPDLLPDLGWRYPVGDGGDGVVLGEKFDRGVGPPDEAPAPGGPGGPVSTETALRRRRIAWTVWGLALAAAFVVVAVFGPRDERVVSDFGGMLAVLAASALVLRGLRVHAVIDPTTARSGSAADVTAVFSDPRPLFRSG